MQTTLDMHKHTPTCCAHREKILLSNTGRGTYLPKRRSAHWLFLRFTVCVPFDFTSEGPGNAPMQQRGNSCPISLRERLFFFPPSDQFDISFKTQSVRRSMRLRLQLTVAFIISSSVDYILNQSVNHLVFRMSEIVKNGRYTFLKPEGASSNVLI